jgi:hypothetical protein
VNHHFSDITSRIVEDPSWWDSNGTPRYGKFRPNRCPDIYSDIVVLLRIACQSCGREFDVEMHAVLWGEQFNPKKLHYGDPPSHDCVGDTMNCDDLAVVEVWHRDSCEDFVRLPEHEGLME